jgi:hypothetical protein
MRKHLFFILGTKDILIGAGVHDLCVDLSKPNTGWQLAYVSR